MDAEKKNPLANRGPRQPVASKAQFVDSFAEFCNKNGVQIVIDGRAHKSKEDFWAFYKKVKNFEVSIASASGRLSLAGVGRFTVKKAGRGETPRPVVRFNQSSFVEKFLKENPSMINTDSRITDSETIKAATFKIYDALEAASGSAEGKEVQADEASNPAIVEV